MTATASFDIRLLGPDDAALMRALLACFAEAFGQPDEYCAAQPGERYLADLLASPCFIALVALAEDGVAGGLTAYELRKPEQERSEVYVYDLAVAEPYRRRGIATALLAALKPVAKARGAWVIFVQADLTDPPAIALYSKLGDREEALNFDILVD